MRSNRQLNNNVIARGYCAAGADDRHDASFTNKLTFLISIEHRAHEPCLERVELRTRVSQAGHLDDRVSTEPKVRAPWQPQEVDTLRRDILAEIAGSDRKS